MRTINPFLATDAYKVGHPRMYPKGTKLVYSNFTPRSSKHSNTDIGGVVSFGQQMVMREIHEMFLEGFFNRDKAEVLGEISTEYSMFLGEPFDTTHIAALHDLRYLPICVKALPEGTIVPYGVPVLTIVNTNPEFYWITNFLETLLSNLLWKPMTSATTAFAYRELLHSWMKRTDETNEGFVDFQAHDFSMRGMDSLFATMSSGLGHATAFKGSDSLPVVHGARLYYDADGFVVGSVNATEHSVMCAGTKDDELGTFRHLMSTFPTGILSIVSDTWDLWKVINEILPELKKEILARDGKIVIRPDSGDPVDIICGTFLWESKEQWDMYNGVGSKDQLDKDDTPYSESTPEETGVIELLWEIFGGTINSQGYKVLDPHIGAIYGDSITLDRADEICERLEKKGFASTNIVLGIGSYTYQYNTRDTHGFAMKATYVEIEDEHGMQEERPIFKDPVTDDGTKKSAKGLLVVEKSFTGQYELIDNVSWEHEEGGELEQIYYQGHERRSINLEHVRRRINELIN
tara:strand:+ start:11560 stop:13116 length:1557 start_codon:yes stop_codon:yes gene_type:complete